MDLNRITLIGRVNGEPSPVVGDGERAVTLTLVTTRDAGKTVECFAVQFSGKLAEIVLAYVEPDAKLYVEGRLFVRGDRVGVIGEQVILLSSKRRAGSRKTDG